MCLRASAGTKSSVKQKSRNVYVNSKCELCVCVCVCVCVYTHTHTYSKLHFFFCSWFNIVYNLDYLCFSIIRAPTSPQLPRIIRQHTVLPTITSYNIWSMCLSNKLIAKMKHSNCSNTNIGSEVYAKGKWPLHLLGTPCL
jgi:hypothetical protein